MTLYEIILLSSLLGNAWANHLTGDDGLFSFIPRLLNKAEVKYKIQFNGLNLFCVYCTSGRIAFVWALVAFCGCPYFVLTAFLCAGAAITVSHFIDKLWHL